MALTKRVEKLREELLSYPKAICTERARLITESYKATEGSHPYIVRAKALQHILENMTIYIRDGELIVGNQTSEPHRAFACAETGANWVLEQLDHFNTREMRRFLITDEQKKELRELLPYWENKTLLHNALNQLNDETLRVYKQKYPVISPNLCIRGHAGHYVPDYGRVIREGFSAIEQEAAQYLKDLDLSDPASLDKENFYRSVIITCQAIKTFAKRYADLAFSQAQASNISAERREELLNIQKICDKVPYYGADTFQEAVQSLWLTHLVAQIEGDGFAYSIGRIDQFLIDCYNRDKKENGLTKEAAQEIMDCFILKSNEITRIADVPPTTSYFGGVNMSQNTILGGLTPDGADGYNEVSEIVLKADENVHMDQPNLSIRVHKGVTDEALLHAIADMKSGGGKPAVFNDEIIIPSLLTEKGVTIEEARDYAIVGCVEPVVANCTNGWTNAAMFNMAKCLELALHDGVDPFSKEQIGPKTGKLEDFSSFNDVMKAYNEQVAYFVKQMVIMLNTWDTMHGELLPIPYMSSITGGCLEKGEDIARGGAKYNYMGPQGVGLSNVADSLMVLKKVVFEDKQITLKEMVEKLDKNFEGDEYFRQGLVNKVSKYGNNIDEVDQLAREVGRAYCDEVAKYKCARGGHYRPGLFPVASHVPLGGVVGALPSGRLSGTPLNDGISPVSGCDINGPTASLLSVSKVEHIRATNGTLLNMKLHPTAISTEPDMKKLALLIRAFAELNLMHIQFNVVSRETLLAAQENPEEYRDLIVRVAGYSANFVELDRKMQDDIINRTQQEL
jgi:formate C-acetyltransferase